MKNLAPYLLGFTLLWPGPLVAAAPAKEELLRLTVKKGEAVTVMRAERTGTKVSLLIGSEGGEAAARALLPDDLAYLKEKVAAVPPGREGGCGRAELLMEGTLLATEIVACAEDPTPRGRALLQLANLLAGYL